MDCDGIEELVRVELGPRAMTATLALRPGIPDGQLNEAVIMSIVAHRLRMTSQIETAVCEAIGAYRADPLAGCEAVIARAIDPVDGVDGQVRLEPGVLPARRPKDRPTSDDAQRLGGADSEAEPPSDAGAEAMSETDHYRTCLETLSTGQLIGYAIEAVEGVDGVDVTGASLAARRPKPLALQLPGGVVRLEDGALKAVFPGVLHFEPPRLWVSRQIEVRGCVDFNTGNINFDGDLIVHKGIKDCFVVRVTGQIRVYALVEAASLYVGGSAVLEGGMAGRGKGLLSVAAELKTRYLDNVHVDVGCDAFVEREVINCQTTIGRNFHCPSGGVTGGTLSVARTCELGQAGASTGTPTRLVLGRIRELEDLIVRAERLVGVLETGEARLQTRRGQVAGGGGKISPAQAEELTEIDFAMSTARSRIAKVRHHLGRIRLMTARNTSVDLIVRSRLCAGVIIYAGNYVAEATSDLKGPIRISMGEHELIVTDLLSNSAVPLSTVMRVRRY